MPTPRCTLPNLFDRVYSRIKSNRKIPRLYSGPLITPAAKARVERLIASVEKEGGRIALDGRGVSVPGYPDGNFVGATILEADTTMECYQFVLLFLPSVEDGELMTLFCLVGRRSSVPYLSSSRLQT